jgi:hypothetical protein
MSPSRTRRPLPRARSRREIVTAVVVCAGIVLGTVLIVWLLRPADPAVPGSGGLMTRQPRASLLLVLTGIAVITAVAVIMRRRGHRRRLDWRGTAAIVVVVLIVGAILAGVFWPGGLVRHWPKRPKPVTPPSTTASTGSPTTAHPATTLRPTTPSTRRP